MATLAREVLPQGTSFEWTELAFQERQTGNLAMHISGHWSLLDYASVKDLPFGVAVLHMFKKPVTVNYPYQKVPVFPKYRGKQVLMRDENGLEKCVACGLCSVACPADAIYLEAAENDGTVMAGPRYASVYQIHKTRCIFCGMCEEACPVPAIFIGKD